MGEREIEKKKERVRVPSIKFWSRERKRTKEKSVSGSKRNYDRTCEREKITIDWRVLCKIIIVVRA